MLHPSLVPQQISETLGHGLVAQRPLPRGTIVWVRDALDQTVPQETLAALPQPLRELVRIYSYIDRHGQFVMPWDHGRFENHSCAPNCLMTGYDFEIAVRDIEAGEQVTGDYALYNLEPPWTCQCHSSGCRGRILWQDRLRLAEDWDRQLRNALPSLMRVEQPLWLLVAEQREVLSAMADVSRMRSCAHNFFVSPQTSGKIVGNRC